MATQYHFLVSCKKITDTEWTMEMQSDSGKVPMSVVHPDSETDGVLTANPITQTIAEARIMIHHLRQLNRHSGRATVGHNDSVIWNVNRRLSQLELGQQITVKISYFEHKGLRSGLYEINSLGVSSPVNRAQPLIAPFSQKEKARDPQTVADALTSLKNHVETLQQELHEAQRVLHKYGRQLESQEKQIHQLETENHQLKESRISQTTSTPSNDSQPQEPAASQPATSVEETVEDHTDTEAQGLFQEELEEKQVQQLETENDQPGENKFSQTTSTPSSDSQPQEPAASQPATSVEETVEDHTDTEAQGLFQEELEEKQVQQLETENDQPRESRVSQTTSTPSSDSQPQEPTASQPATSVEETVEDHTDTEAQGLFQEESEERRVQQLAVENGQPGENKFSQTTSTPSSDSQPQEPAASQPATSVEETVEDHTDTEARSLFKQFINSAKFSKLQTTRQLSSKRAR